MPSCINAAVRRHPATQSLTAFINTVLNERRGNPHCRPPPNSTLAANASQSSCPPSSGALAVALLRWLAEANGRALFVPRRSLLVGMGDAIASCHAGAAIRKLVGRPWESKPRGTETDGRPARLKG